MKYHDYHLKSYSVHDGGTRIAFTLCWSYSGATREDSLIEFTDVAVYRFSHTAGAIITDITELPLDNGIEREAQFFSAAAGQDGLRYWQSDLAAYGDVLKTQGFRFYDIISAVGFSGFVIAKCVK